MRYDFICEPCHKARDFYDWYGTMTVVAPMSKGPGEVFCPYGHGAMHQIYRAPIISLPETSAVEVLNRHARGEGDPLAGYTQEQTKWMANEKARIQKREKGQKSGGGPSQSFPGGGAVSRVYGD